MADEPQSEAPAKRKRGRPRKEDSPERARDRDRKAKREVPPAAGEEKPATPAKPRVRDELKVIAGEYVVLILWGMSWVAVLPFGGHLPMLTDVEIKEGSERALPLMEKFPIVVLVLSFAGLPVWIVRKIAAKVTFAPPKQTGKQTQTREQPAPDAPPPAAAAAVTQDAPPASAAVPGQSAEEIARAATQPPDNVRQIRP